MTGDDRLLTIDEVSDRLRVPVSTMRYWRQTGQAPPAVKIGRRVLFATSDIDRWIEDRRDAG